MPFIVGAIGAVVGAIGSAAVAVGSFIGGLGFFGQALVGIGLNVASSLLQRAFAKKPKQPPGGVQFDRQYGQDVPRQVACGLVGIAGHDCYINTYGSSNKYLQQVYTLSDYPSDGFSRLAINGEWATLGAVADPDKGYPVTSGDFANLIWIKFIDGRQAAADSYLVHNANPADRWTVDHIGVGITAALISMTFDKEKNNQLPDFFFEFRGARLYDWRKDSTVGGTGAHRWDDPATHEFSENPIVIDYNYRRGFAVNGDLFCGMDMPAGDLPLDKYTAAASICDELAGGETRYRCSIMLDAGPDTTHGDNIEAVMLACGGMVVDGVDGSWPVVGSDQPVVMTITDDDLIVGAPVQFRAKRSMSELVNSVSGNFPNPDELWSMVGYDPQISEAAIAVDRRTRDLAIDFPQVRSSRQAAQLASIYLKENRYEASATITVRPRFQVLEPGDWVRWNSARYGDRTYTVSEATLASLSSDGPRNTQLSLQERDGSIYDGVTPPAIVLPFPPGAPAYLAEVQDFTAFENIVETETGAKRPGIRLGWTAVDDVTVTHVDIEYWPSAQPAAVMRKSVTADISVVQLSEGLVSETEYTVRTRLRTMPVRTVAWSAPKLVTTDAARFAAIDLIDNAVTEQKLADAAVTGQKIRDEAIAASKFAATIKPIEIVDALPAAGNVEGRQAYNTADGKLYRYHAGAWTSAVTGSDLPDASITQSKLANAAVTASKLADQAVTLTKFAASLKPIETFAALPATGNAEGRTVFNTTDGKLYRYHVGAFTAVVAAADITGQLTDAQLVAISAAKLTGQITSTQITDGAISTPKLAAGAVTANTLAVGAVVAGKIAADAVTATTIGVGAVTTGKLAAGAVTANELAANAVTAGKVQAGAISTAALAAGAVTTNILAASAVTSDRIAAGAITARELVIADFDNVIPDNQITSAAAWSLVAGWDFVADAAAAGMTGFNSRGAIKHTYVAGETGFFGAASTLPIPVTEGTEYYFEAQSYSAAAYSTWQRIHSYDATGAEVGLYWTIGTAASVPAGLTTRTTVFTVPATAKTIIVRNFVSRDTITADVYVGGFFGKRRGGGNLIVDGAITSGKIAANSITSDLIAAGAISATKLAVNSVTAGVIAAGAVGASQIAAGAITSGKIAAGAIATNALAVGGGKNLLPNSSFAAGEDNWDAAGLTGTWNLVAGIRPAGVSWGGHGYGTFMIQQPNGDQNGYCDLRSFPAQSPSVTLAYPCQPGDRFEASAYVSTHRCEGTLYIGFANINGVAVQYDTVPIASNASDPDNPDLWPRYVVRGTAPADAAFVHALIRKLPTTAGQTNSYMFINKPMLARCPPNATEPTPYSDGSFTVIDSGGIVSGSITGDKIAAGSITGDKVQANSITGDKIAANTITGDKIQANSITADKIDTTDLHVDSAMIGTATIQTLNIAADQITGSTSSGSAQTTIQPGTGWVQLDSHSFDNPNPCSVLTYFECYIWRATGTGSVQCRLRRLEDNRTILSFSSTADDPDHKTSFFLDGGKLQGTNTYVIEATALGGTCYAIGSYVLQWNKR